MTRCGSGGRPASIVRLRYSASFDCLKNLHVPVGGVGATHTCTRIQRRQLQACSCSLPGVGERALP